MKRPRLLWEAASHLVQLNGGKMKTRNLVTIQDEEMELNNARIVGLGDYNCCRHVELLAEYLIAKRRDNS